MSLKKPKVPNKPSNSKFFVTPSRSNSFSQNVQSILTLNALMPNKHSNNHNVNNSQQMDTMSESGFKLSNFSLGSIYRNRRKPRSQSININPLNVIDEKFVIDGAMFFLSNSNGLCGSLSFTKKSILFELGRSGDESPRGVVNSKEADPEPKCPIKEDAFVRDSYEIEFSNIGDVHTEIANDLLTISIFCRDFRHVKILLKQSDMTDLVVDRIKTISFDNIVQANKEIRVCLWEYLFNKYQFRYMSDWIKHESWYLKNFKIRFSVFNEIGQCATLPETVIVPRPILDNMLERFSSISSANRVPVITYLNRISGHMIIRSTLFRDSSLQNLLSKNTVYPLRELAVDQIFPDLSDIDKYYAKLRKYCFSVTKTADTSLSSFADSDHAKSFWSKCSPWFKCLAHVLKFTSDLANIVKNEASVGLVESSDTKINCVLACLVQIVIDPSRRTIAGFESLLSKEWIYLSGYKSRNSQNSQKYRVTQCPSTTLFVFFLDAVHQLIVHNPRAFEFTTFYLVALMDIQFQSENYKREQATRFERNKQHCCIVNPLYVDSDTEPTVAGHITNIKFFYTLYFRHIRSDIYKYTPEEGIFWNELHRRSCI